MCFLGSLEKQWVLGTSGNGCVPERAKNGVKTQPVGVHQSEPQYVVLEILYPLCASRAFHIKLMATGVCSRAANHDGLEKSHQVKDTIPKPTGLARAVLDETGLVRCLSDSRSVLFGVCSIGNGLAPREKHQRIAIIMRFVARPALRRRTPYFDGRRTTVASLRT